MDSKLDQNCTNSKRMDYISSHIFTSHRTFLLLIEKMIFEQILTDEELLFDQIDSTLELVFIDPTELNEAKVEFFVKPLFNAPDNPLFDPFNGWSFVSIFV